MMQRKRNRPFSLYQNALSGAAEPAEMQIAPFDVEVLVGE